MDKQTFDEVMVAARTARRGPMEGNVRGRESPLNDHLDAARLREGI